MKLKMIASSLSVLSIFVCCTLTVVTGRAQNEKVFSGGPNWLVGHGVTVPSLDPTKPVARGYVVVDVVPAIGGAKIIVEVFQDRLDSPVQLSLYAAVNNGENVFALPIELLDAGVSDPELYIQRREIFLSYDRLQSFFTKNAPNASGLRVEAGLALIVKADFPSGHNWGGFDRGGVFYLPPPLDENGHLVHQTGKTKTDVSSPLLTRATALDVAYPITQEMINTFNNRSTRSGLKLNGQIRSRVEGEGKYQLTSAEYLETKTKLFALAKDPAEQLRVFGPGWTLVPETRYYKKDKYLNVITDDHGLPVPDPMIDTYYDNANYDAASRDMAIRYRWTEGNKTGSWNFKPDGGRTDHVSGIVYRIEYGVDTTDDKPETIRQFADSASPLNPFRIIRDKVSDAQPSDFLVPSVRLEDVRHKFKLKGPNNLAIEISTDQVRATNLRVESAPGVDYQQIEMDIDHLSTASQNIAQVTSTVDYSLGDKSLSAAATIGTSVYNWKTFTNHPAAQSARARFMAGLGADAFIDGRPVLHILDDLNPSSPILMSRAADFNEAARVIAALRDHAIGPTWRPAPQKYALAAAALKLIDENRWSPSTQKIQDIVHGLIDSVDVPTHRPAKGAPNCEALFGI